MTEILIRNCINCGRPLTRNFTDLCYICEIQKTKAKKE